MTLYHQTAPRLNVHKGHLKTPIVNTCKDKTTNEEVLQRTGQKRLQDIVAERRFQFMGHII